MQQAVTNNVSQTALPFVQGGGEMGALTRAYDWSRTPPGPLHTWPQSLRSAVNTLLHARFPMLLFWGPELTRFITMPTARAWARPVSIRLPSARERAIAGPNHGIRSGRS